MVPDPTASPPLISDAPGQAVAQNYFGYTEVDRTFEPLIRLDTRGGSLYGQTGFTRVNIFKPYWIEDDALVFVDAGGFATYEPGLGANLGVGWRYYMEDLDRIIGVNAWYDVDGGHQKSYHQFGLGFESLGRYLDYRINGYIPVSHTSHNLSNGIITGGNPTFVDHFIFLDRYYRHETAFKGFDAEMGGPLPFVGRYGLSAYAGMYFFTGLNVGNITGVSARLTGQVNEAVTVGAQFTHDAVFDNNVQIQVNVTLPDGSPSRWLRQPRVRDRLTAPVLRNYRVFAHDDVVVVSEKAINPLDNQPYFIDHINPNQSTVTGDGTVENPFTQLAQFDNRPFGEKSNVDIIYVQPNLDGTSENLDAGVTLLSNQRLLSTSVPHTFTVIPGQADVTGNTTFDLPGFIPTDPLTLPILTRNGGGDVVTFTTGARNIEVSGFEIVGNATGNAIAGVNNTKINVNRNIIRDGVNGIQLTNLSGTGYSPETDTVDFTGPGDGSSFDDNIFRNNIRRDAFNAIIGGDGLQIVNNPGTGTLDVQITDNRFLGNGNDGVHLEAIGSSVRGLIDGNSTQEADGSEGGNRRHAVFLSADNGFLDFFTAAENRGIRNNIFNYNGTDTIAGDGVHIESTNDSFIAMSITNNVFGDLDVVGSQNTGFGVYFSADSGVATMQIGGSEETGNDFYNNSLGGVRYDLSGTNVTTSDISFNRIIIPLLDILNGYDEFTLAANDDGSTGLVPIGFDANFFGVLFDQVFVNNNGNITLNAPLGTFTPFPIVTNGIPMIAPFFADVDTRSGNEVTYGTEIVNGRNSFGVNWNEVRHFNASGGGTNGLPTNTFQLVLIDRSDTGAGNFDIIFNYEEIVWEAGEASGSDPQGLGGSSARVGYTNGVNQSFEFPGSGVNGALLDGGPAATSLVSNSINSNIPGRYVFEARNGQVNQGTIGDADAVEINVSGNAQLINTSISNNEIIGNPGYGIRLNASNNAQIANLLIDGNTITSNDGGIRLQGADNTIIDAVIINNIVTQSLSSGLELVTSSNNADAMTIDMSDNIFQQSGQNGASLLASGSGVVVLQSDRDQFLDNTLDGFSAQSADTSQVFITLNNVTATGNGQNGLEFNATAFSIMDVVIASPPDILFAGVGSDITGNGANGIAGNSRENAQLYITAFGNNTSVNDNLQDGIHLTRFDASLFIADFDNMLITGNQDDGIQFDTQGAAPSDPNQPFPGTTAQLILNRIQLNQNGSTDAENGGNGLEVNTYADSALVVTATTSTFNANFDDGIRVFSGDNSSFGESLGNRSTFDNVQVIGNGANGVKLMAAGNNTQKSRMFVEFNSNSGDTNISDNARNGIQASSPYGNLDLLVQGDTVGPANFRTRIQNNGGDGIQFNVADIAREDDGDITVVDPDRQSDLDMLAFQFRNDNLLNLEAVDLFNGIGTLTVSNIIIGDENPNDTVDDGNSGNGINVYVGNSNLYASSGAEAGLNVTAFSNIAGLVNLNVDQSIIQGNDLNGITVDSQGIHSYAGSAFFFPISSQGNLVNATITNSLIANNTGNGINFDIDGLHGRSAISSLFFGVITRLSQNEILIENNVIQNNGGSGTRFESNTGQMLRFDYTRAPIFTSSFPSEFWGIAFPDPAVVPGNGTVFSPFAIGSEGWTFYQAGFASGIDLDNYLNMLTDNNSNMQYFNNTVQFNGIAENGTASGLNIRLSTNSYLSLDVGGSAGSGQGNFFSGNIGSDVKIRSFTATDAAGVPIQPGASTPGDDTAAPPIYDHIFLDDTAQLDLRFNNNTGRTLDTLFNPPTGPLNNAGYNNNDPGKGGGGFRSTQVYQVDDGFNLNANNNWTQDIESIFSGSGNFFLRTVADPLFPNPAFPENWNTDIADPFLP